MKDVKALNRSWRESKVRNGGDLSLRAVHCLLHLSGQGDFRHWDTASIVEPGPIAALGREHIATSYQVGKKTLAEIEAWLAAAGEELKP